MYACIPISAQWLMGKYRRQLKETASQSEILFEPDASKTKPYMITFNPHAGNTAVGRGDGTIDIYDRHGKQIGTPLTAHTGEVIGLAWNAEGTALASGSHDCCLWNCVENQPAKIQTLTTDGGIPYHLFWSPNNTYVAAIQNKLGVSNQLCLYDLEGKSTEIAYFDRDSFSVTHLAWKPDSSNFALALKNGSILFYDVQGNPLHQIFVDPECIVTNIAWNPDGTQLAASTDKGTIYLFDAQGSQTGTCTCPDNKDLLFDKLTWNHDGTILASVSHDGVIRIWNRSGDLLDFFDVYSSIIYKAINWAVNKLINKNAETNNRAKVEKLDYNRTIMGMFFHNLFWNHDNSLNIVTYGNLGVCISTITTSIIVQQAFNQLSINQINLLRQIMTCSLQSKTMRLPANALSTRNLFDTLPPIIKNLVQEHVEIINQQEKCSIQ